MIENPYRAAIQLILKREAKNSLEEVIKEMDKIRKRENLKPVTTGGLLSVGKYLNTERFKKVI